MDPRILHASRILERHLDCSLAIEQVAHELGMSTHHFHRLFVEETGEPPASFLRRIRLDAAALRLKWSNEAAADISASIAYENRSAFIRAFKRQFGVSPSRYRRNHQATLDRPESMNGHRVVLREVESLNLLAHRYVGDVFRLGEYWQDFLTRLPKGLPLAGVAYVGLLHDDFRVTNPDKVRYDCAIALGGGAPDPRMNFGTGLHLVQTIPGRYATIDHRGHYLRVPETYDLLCQGWLIPKGHIPGHQPAIEIHSVPRNLQDREDLRFTILFPVE